MLTVGSLSCVLIVDSLFIGDNGKTIKEFIIYLLGGDGYRNVYPQPLKHSRH